MSVWVLQESFLEGQPAPAPWGVVSAFQAAERSGRPHWVANVAGSFRSPNLRQPPAAPDPSVAVSVRWELCDPWKIASLGSTLHCAGARVTSPVTKSGALAPLTPQDFSTFPARESETTGLATILTWRTRLCRQSDCAAGGWRSLRSPN